jgi:hypothetical protein
MGYHSVVASKRLLLASITMNDHFKLPDLGSAAQDTLFRFVVTKIIKNPFCKQHPTKTAIQSHFSSQVLSAEEMPHAVHCPTAVSAGLHPKYTATFKLHHMLEVITPTTSIVYVLDIVSQSSSLR